LEGDSEAKGEEDDNGEIGFSGGADN